MADDPRTRRPTATSTQPIDQQVRPIGVPEFMKDPVTGEEVPFEVTRPSEPVLEDTRTMRTGRPALAWEGGPVRPKYWTGDEWKPASWSPDEIAELQTALVQAGLIDGAEVRLGVFDEETRNGFEKLLGRANGMGLTWEDALVTALESPEPAEPLQVKLTDPNDLRRVFKTAAFEVSSTQFTPGQIDAMVASYHEKEREYQEALARGEETVFAPPDPGTFVEMEAERVNPEGVIEERLQDAQNEWFSMLGSPVG